jgi:hypothetical protein
VRFVLNQLARGGWTVRNGVAWPGGGDVDHLVRSPDALGLAIETKTLTFSQEQMRRTDTPVGPTARYRSGDPSSGRHTPEYDRDNYLHLLGVIGELKHDGVKIDVRQERFDVVANEVADYEQQVRRQRGRVPPIYFFADPFGFSGIHLETLGRLLAVKRWEALLTFIVGAMRRVLDHPDLETPLTDFLAGHRGASAQALSAAGDPG